MPTTRVPSGPARAWPTSSGYVLWASGCAKSSRSVRNARTRPKSISCGSSVILRTCRTWVSRPLHKPCRTNANVRIPWWPIAASSWRKSNGCWSGHGAKNPPSYKRHARSNGAVLPLRCQNLDGVSVPFLREGVVFETSDSRGSYLSRRPS